MLDVLQFAQQRVMAQEGKSIVRCLQHLTRTSPASPHAWQLLAYIYINELGQPAEGIRYLQGAIAASPQNADYALALAQVLAALSVTCVLHHFLSID